MWELGLVISVCSNRQSKRKSIQVRGCGPEFGRQFFNGLEPVGIGDGSGIVEFFLDTAEEIFSQQFREPGNALCGDGGFKLMELGFEDAQSAGGSHQRGFPHDDGSGSPRDLQHNLGGGFVSEGVDAGDASHKEEGDGRDRSSSGGETIEAFQEGVELRAFRLEFLHLRDDDPVDFLLEIERGMGIADVLEELAAFFAAQQAVETGMEPGNFVGLELLQGVIEVIDGGEDDVAFRFDVGGEGIGEFSAPLRVGPAHGNHQSFADGVIKFVNGAGPAFAALTPPASNRLDDQPGGDGGPVLNANELADGQAMGELNEFAAAMLNLFQIAGEASFGIEEEFERAFQGCTFDLIEVEPGDFFDERNRGLFCGGGSGFKTRGTGPLTTKEGESILLGGGTVVGSEVDADWIDAGFLLKGLEPAGPIFLIERKLAPIEDNEDAFAFESSLAEELFDGGIVVFLLSQDGDENVGALTDPSRPFPVDRGIAIDIGGIEEEEVGSEMTDFASEEEMSVFGLEGS